VRAAEFGSQNCYLARRDESEPHLVAEDGHDLQRDIVADGDLVAHFSSKNTAASMADGVTAFYARQLRQLLTDARAAGVKVTWLDDLADIDVTADCVKEDVRLNSFPVAIGLPPISVVARWGRGLAARRIAYHVVACRVTVSFVLTPL
jgi:hypothetical protein